MEMTMQILLTPPLAFLIDMALVGLLVGLGRWLAGPAHANAIKSSTYASGESGPSVAAAPGYQPFFVVALFFAVLHLGVLMLATGAPSLMSALYLAGLVLVLVVLIV
jgi:NADH:ubiquinone oxidoreductase subunit 3 (subunit A)